MKTILIISQVYVPDPASVGQHVADVAQEMSRRGWRAIVFTADSRYDDPRIKYPRRSSDGGVEVRRFRWSSSGKRSLLMRLLGQLSFVLQSLFAGILSKNVDALLITTIPQIIGLAAVPLCVARRLKLVYWVMDLNPDQAVALGQFKENALPVKAFDWLNRAVLRQSERIIVLDRFMARRLTQKAPIAPKLSILPPWPHEDHLAVIAKENNPFVREHGLNGKRVFMYSGNHSLAHPLSTFLEAIPHFSAEARFMFLFVGGGLRKAEVEEVIQQSHLKNLRSLPYQPLEKLAYSLCAADVHLVSMGNEMVGCVHPCKIYGAMAIGKPVLYLGPNDSPIGELVAKYNIGWQVDHGQVEKTIETIKHIGMLDEKELVEMGARARRVVQEFLSKRELCGLFCSTLEAAAGTDGRS